MIKEDYVSFETAKLLKEKGFDAECHSHYYPCHYPDGSIQYHKYEYSAQGNRYWYDIYSLKTLPVDHYLAPTLQMTMKWLREVHNLSIEPYYTHKQKYKFAIQEIPTAISLWMDLPDELYATSEEACETAIQYCLQNLI